MACGLLRNNGYGGRSGVYRAIKSNGDCVAVPQLLVSKLTTAGGGEARFRVGLYAVTRPEVDAHTAAKELRLKVGDVREALQYWEGAGLLEKLETPTAELEAPLEPRRRMTTPEATAAAKQDGRLAGMYAEIQRIFGGVVSQSDYNIFTTLYIEDAVPADLILLAAGYCAGQGKASARYIEKLLMSWRRDGIDTCEKADAYLQLLARRTVWEEQVATLLGVPAKGLTLAERRRVAAWAEDYHYGTEMLEAARAVAGERNADISYLHGILKKWDAKGYRTPRDVQQSETNRNLRVQGSQQAIAPEDDMLMNITDYVPLRQRGKTNEPG